ncbi:hypothetical protein V6N11_043370 [Hibiscus sabdariffa]|uniref:Uncharacterized protein n=1 Tax=Hibiscus sabdariffa TaxID=183260 RepID=A0ABR2AAV2_9ROSI
MFSNFSSGLYTLRFSGMGEYPLKTVILGISTCGYVTCSASVPSILKQWRLHEASSRSRAIGSPQLPLTLAMENIRAPSLSHVMALWLSRSRLPVCLELW